jgi:hypothetical protein
LTMTPSSFLIIIIHAMSLTKEWRNKNNKNEIFYSFVHIDEEWELYKPVKLVLSNHHDFLFTHLLLSPTHLHTSILSSCIPAMLLFLCWWLLRVCLCVCCDISLLLLCNGIKQHKSRLSSFFPLIIISFRNHSPHSFHWITIIILCNDYYSHRWSK